MPIKRYVVLNERFKVGAMFPHEVDNVLTMFEVAATVTFELVAEGTEQAVSGERI